MCGIFGYIGNKSFDIKKATDVIEHRGPDAEGFLQYLPELNKINKEHLIISDRLKVAFGFRRLAIIDLHKHANQPFSEETNDYHITFNGEIYNYIELRNELKQLGYKFLTDSDTEVLLNAYIHWGTSCFSKLNGMWALAILDVKNQKVVFSRDRFGIKPFFYHINEVGEVYWASEIKQLFEVGVKKKINENVIKDFIDINVVDSTKETFFDGIFHLPTGSFTEIDFNDVANLKINESRYWELEVQDEFLDINYSDAKKKFRELFLNSVSLRMRSDVTVGSCLSGGLDSSSIVASVAHQFENPIQTFTSRFDIKKFDESEYVHLLANEFDTVKTKFCELTEDLFVSEIDKVLYHQDEPFGSMSILAQWEVMKLAKKNGAIVLLDGQGGDELLAGYRKFYAFYLKEKLTNFELHKFFPALFRLLVNKEMNFFDFKQIGRYLGVKPASINYYSKKGKQLKSNSTIGFSASNTLIGRSKLDVERYSFPPLLRFEDRNSMAFSIETRVPFMDYRLVEFLYSISSDYKIKKGYTKAVLRDGLEGILPRAIQKRKSKLGFSTPQEVWMTGKLKPLFKDYFAKMKNPYFDKKNIYESFNAYPENRVSSDFFFRIYCFDKWYQKHFN